MTTRLVVPVHDQNGVYQIWGGNLESETLAQVRAAVQNSRQGSLHVIEPLMGWGAYKWAIRVNMNGWQGLTYFVAGDARPRQID